MKSFFFAGIFLTVFSGCSLFLPEREYEIAFPHLPREYFFIEFWEVDILSLQGGERRLSFPAGQDGFLLSAEKEEALILLATPGGPGSFALKPASLYLNGHSGTRGFLSFADGPAGSVLRRAHREGYDLRRFNVERFFRQFNRNGLASPWFADLACVAESILQGEMALYRIKAAPLFSLDSEAGGDNWIGEDPFLRSGVPPLLPEGRHRFYDPSGGKILEIVMDGDGNAARLEYAVNSR